MWKICSPNFVHLPQFFGVNMKKIFELPPPRCPSSCIETILKSPEKAFNSLFCLPYSHLHRAAARHSALPPMVRPMRKLINHPPKTWTKMWKNISKWREVEKVSGDLARDSFEYPRSATNPSVATRNSNLQSHLLQVSQVLLQFYFPVLKKWQLITKVTSAMDLKVNLSPWKLTCQWPQFLGVPVRLHVSSCNNLRGTAAKECKKMCHFWRKCHNIWKLNHSTSFCPKELYTVNSWTTIRSQSSSKPRSHWNCYFCGERLILWFHMIPCSLAPRQPDAMVHESHWSPILAKAISKKHDAVMACNGSL